MAAGGSYVETVAAHAQPTLVDLAQRHAFDHDVRQRAGLFPDCLGGCRSAQPRLSCRADFPGPPRRRWPPATDRRAGTAGAARKAHTRPNSPGHSQRVVTDAGSQDALRLALDGQVNIRGEDRVQMGRNNQRLTAGCWPRPAQAGIHIPDRIDPDLLQVFFREAGAHEFGPFRFVRRSGRGFVGWQLPDRVAVR